MNRKLAILVVAAMLATILVGCGATPEPETIIQTVEVERVETVEVEVVQTVEVEAEPVEKTVVEFWSMKT
jgi:outer membrane lipoprotein-sorting protein